MIEILVLNKTTKRPLVTQRPHVDGDWIRQTEKDTEGNVIRVVEFQYHEPVEEQALPVITMNNPVVTSEAAPNGVPKYLMSDIRVLKPNQDVTIELDVNDPLNLLDGINKLNVIVERVINGYEAVDDFRVEAIVQNGKINVQLENGIPTSGNYLVRASRQNHGFSLIGAPFRVEFDTLEFNVQLNKK